MNEQSKEISKLITDLHVAVKQADETACLVVVGDSEKCMCSIHSDGPHLAKALVAACIENTQLIDLLKAVLELVDDFQKDSKDAHDFSSNTSN